MDNRYLYIVLTFVALIAVAMFYLSKVSIEEMFMT